MNPNEILGANLKRLRTARSLSLGQLSALCGVSKIALSQIERGEANPTMNTIWKLADGLNVRYTELIDRYEQDLRVIRREDAVLQTENAGGYRSYSYYSASAERSFDLFVIELEPLTEYASAGHSAGAEEYVMLHEGTLEVEVEGTTVRLNAGDAFSFRGEKRHIYRNVGATDVRAVTLIQY